MVNLAAITVGSVRCELSTTRDVCHATQHADLVFLQTTRHGLKSRFSVS